MVASLGFCIHSIMPSTKWQFYFFLSSLDSFHFFSAVLGLQVLYWIKVTRVGILVLLLILEEILSAFHCFIWCWLWVCLYGLSYVDVCSFYTQFVESFYQNGCWISLEAFSASVEIIWFLFSICLHGVSCAGIELSLLPWDKVHFIMVYNSFIVEFSLLIFAEDFLHVIFISDIVL